MGEGWEIFSKFPNRKNRKKRRQEGNFCHGERTFLRRCGGKIVRRRPSGSAQKGDLIY